MWVGLIGFRLCKGNDLQRREQAVLLDRRSGIFSGKDNFIGMLSRQDGKHRPGGIVGRMGYQVRIILQKYLRRSRKLTYQHTFNW